MAEGHQEPTFNWNGNPTHNDGVKFYYNSFMFCNVRYALGDYVYLLPEDEGAPLYIARLKAAYEDTQAADGERLSIQVQWYERRDNSPENLRADMHEKEVMESDCCDTNLVGCIDKKIMVVRARSYEEALSCLSESARTGDWFFCRGRLSSQDQSFTPYTDAELTPSYVDPHNYDDSLDPDYAYEEPRRHYGGGYLPEYGHRGGGGYARGPRAPPPGFSMGPGRGIPGKVCAECGATSTPQWREGPAGPKSLCNACGVRYQRATKAKTNKRPASDRRGGSPPVRGPLNKQARTGPSGSGGRGNGGRGGHPKPAGYAGGRGGRPWGPPGGPGGLYYGDEEPGLGGAGGTDDDMEGDSDMGAGDHRRDASPPPRRGQEPLVRTKTQEAAELLSSFKMGPPLSGGGLGGPSGPSPGQHLNPGGSPGGDLGGRGGGGGAAAGGGPGAGSDMLPVLALDERGRPGSPAAAGFGGPSGSPAHVLRGPLGPSRFARDIPSPILAAAAAVSETMPPLHPEMPAPLPQQMLPLHEGPLAPPPGLAMRHLLAGGPPTGPGAPGLCGMLAEADGALLDAEAAAHNAHAATLYEAAPSKLSEDDLLKLWQRSAMYLGEPMAVPAGMAGILQQLPGPWRVRLMEAKNKVESAFNSANAAAAAVTAVSQVLEQKQRLKQETAVEAAGASRHFQEVVVAAVKQFSAFKPGVGRVVRGPVGPDSSSPATAGPLRIPGAAAASAVSGGAPVRLTGPLPAAAPLTMGGFPGLAAPEVLMAPTAPVPAASPPPAAPAEVKVQPAEVKEEGEPQQQVLSGGAAAEQLPTEPAVEEPVLPAATTTAAAEAVEETEAVEPVARPPPPPPAAEAAVPAGPSTLSAAPVSKAPEAAAGQLNNAISCTSPPYGGADSVEGVAAGAAAPPAEQPAAAEAAAGQELAAAAADDL